MQAADLLHRHPLLVSAMLGMVAGALLGLGWPVNVPPPNAQRVQQWVPPRPINSLRPSEKEFANTRDAPVWGGTGDNASGVKRTVWRLAGIISDPFPAALVFSASTKDSLRIRIGGSLPDGGVITQIEKSGVVYSLDGCSYERNLYDPAASASQGSCASGSSVQK